MSTKKYSRYENELEGYFEDLSESTKEIVKDAILEAVKDKGGPDCWKDDEECIEEIECHSRDGFIAFSHNRGGLMYRNFTDLMSYWGGGYTCTHKKAAKEIERQIEYNFTMISESAFEAFKDKIPGLDLKQCNYHDAMELEKKYPDNEEYKDLRQWIEDAECEYMSDESSSIMHEFRVMYHGQENGTHTASVSAAVNTEGPYHRSHISWAPGVFCEGSKEVQITWKTEKQLKVKLAKALKECSEKVF